MNLDKYRVKESVSDIETHEVFLDTLAHQKEEEIGIFEKKFEVRIKDKAIYFIFGFFLLLVLVIFSRTFYFQIINGKYLFSVAERNKSQVSLIPPERGIIYGSNMTQLVLNAPAYDFVCDKQNFSQTNTVSMKEISIMAQILGKDPGELENGIISSDAASVSLADNVDQQTLLILEARMTDLPDCQIEKNTVRNYAFGPVFSHVLGYDSKITKDELQQSTDYESSDSVGRYGLEKFYETQLRGTPGQLQVIKNASGVKKGNKVISNPKDGYNLVLNIDANLQKVMYDSLEKSIKNIGASKGAAVALNPNTGAVLGLVSYPAYDDNIFSKSISVADSNALFNDPNQPLFDRAIAAHYPTGSTIKPLEASAALQENLISPTKEINDPGYILVKSQYDPNVVYRFGGVEAHGLVDMKKALAVSSNIYFYTVGGGYGDQQGLGPARIKQYLSLFGWDNKTGIDLPGEYSGFIPSPAWKKATKGQSWYDGDTYNMAIGQSDLQTTPLQVADAYCAIANGGTLYKPEIVNKIIDGSGADAKVIDQIQPEVIRSNFIDPANLQIVMEGMRDGVSQPYGLSKYLNDLPVPVAAKTGTAEIGVANHYNVWSSVIAPYTNPQIVLVVTAEDVHGLGAVTLPVAHEVLQWYFSKKQPTASNSQSATSNLKPATSNQ